ncbi:MAG: dihydroorotate dehydrogenase [Thermoplasmatales archaeon]|nr:dihydroorotate dehydrogenase [Thermoplasmatales archaeon]
MANLATKITSLNLRNPTILASGFMDEDAGSMERIFNCGAGAIVTKSIGLEPREGYPNPTVIELEHGILNAMGLPNPGIGEFGDELKKLKKSKIPIIGSIFGANSKEFVELAKKMQSYGADALELNMSCPHAKGYGLEIGSDTELVRKITSKVKEATEIPVFVKISPNLMNIADIAKSAEKGNADGIVAINTVKAMKIDLELKMPVLANKIGGYSGKAIKPIGVRCVYDIYKNVNIPVIGVGGITTGEDALEYIMAGASAIQIGSAIYYRNLDAFKKICDEIEIWMRDHGYKNISELVGVAHT